MQSTSTAYKAALVDAEQTPLYSVVSTVLGDLTKYVSSVTVGSALTTDLPEETRLVAGYASTKLTLEMCGDPEDNDRTAPWLWSPYSSASPFYGLPRIGADISVEMGYQTTAGAETVPVFTGTVTRLEVSAADGTVTLEALDGAERLRHRVDLPMVVAYDLASDQQGGLNSQWVIDYILRTGGFYASPPPRPSCVLLATLHGSQAAEIGTLESAAYQVDDGSGGLVADPGQVPYTTGQWGLCPFPNSGLYFSNYTLDTTVTGSQTAGKSIVMSGWIFVPAGELSTGAFGSDADIGWSVSGGTDDIFVTCTVDALGVATLSVDVSREVSSRTITGPTISPPGWHYVGVQVYFPDSTHVQARFRVDSTTTTSASTAIPAYVGAIPTWTDAQISGLSASDTVQFSIETTAVPAWDDGFVPTALLEPGLSELTAIPTTTAADAWALLQEIVSAEFGTLRFDGAGRAVYWNRRHWRENVAANTVQRTLTSVESILDMAAVELADQIRTRIQVPFQPVTISPLMLLWQMGEIVKVPRMGRLERWAPMGQATAWNVDRTGWVVPEGGVFGTFGLGRSGYRASRTQDGKGPQINNLTMTITPFSNTIKVVFTNPNVFDAWLVSPHGGVSPNGGGTYPASQDGKAAPVIVGQQITRNPAPLDADDVDPNLPTGSLAEALLPGTVADDARLYTAPDSPWRQSGSSAQDCADDLLLSLYRSMPQIQGLSIIGDPSLELGDRVQVRDTLLGIDEPLWIVALNIRFDASGLTQSLTLRPVTFPGGFIFGVAGRNIVGVTPL